MSPKSTQRSRTWVNSNNRALNALNAAEKDLDGTSNRSNRSNTRAKQRAEKPFGSKDHGDRDDNAGNDEDVSDEEGVDTGSDSDGNKWTIGHVNPEDDSELDSDEAMGGSSDEEKFAEFTFRGSSTRKKKNVNGEDGLDEEDEEEDDEEGGMDLVEILDRRMQEEEDEAQGGGKSKGKGKKGGKAEKEEDVEKKGLKRAAPVESDDDEEEDGELKSDMDESDELSNGDTESSDESDEDMADLESDSDNEPANTAKLDALHSLISSLSTTTTAAASGPRVKRPRLDDPNEAKTPGEHNVSLSAVSLQDLLPTITDRQTKKSIKLLSDDTSTKSSGVPGKLSAPLPKRQQDRIDRAAAYAKAKETLSRWTDTVKHNREADHLIFPLPDQDAEHTGSATRLPPTQAFAPLTSLESTISGILKESRMESERQLAEFEQLKTNKLSIEEIQKRTAQLRMARELLYREEIKAKRLKKIKSKTWRRIHKKERERQERKVKEAMLAEGGVAALEEDEEARERRRAEERMTLRHKQSRFAKGLKDSGKAIWDEEARDGALEAVRRGEELTKRIMGKRVRGEDDSDVDSTDQEDDEESEDDLFDEVLQQRKLLEQLKNVEDSHLDMDEKTSMGRLMQMKFMKNAEAARRKENEEAIKQLREELEYEDQLGSEEDPAEEEDDAPISGRRSFKPGKKTKEPQKKKNKRRVTEDGYAVGSDEEPEMEIDSTVDNERGGTPQARNEPTITKNPFTMPGRPNPAITSTNPVTVDKSIPFGGRKHASFHKDPHSNEEKDISTSNGTAFNPWLAPQDSSAAKLRASDTGLSSGKIDAKTARANAKLVKERRKVLQKEQERLDGGGDEDITIDVHATLKPVEKGKESPLQPPQPPQQQKKQKARKVDITKDTIDTGLDVKGPEDHDNNNGDSGESDNDSDDSASSVAEEDITLLPAGKSSSKKNIIEFQQRELVKRAFAGDDVVREFMEEKRKVIEDEETKEIDTTLPGWGSWTGTGIRHRKKSKSKPRFTKTIQGISADSRKDARLPKVIINEKRVKKNAKYQATNVPFPFETREQYERSLRLPVGKEWVTKSTHQEQVMPRVVVKRGVVVEPLRRPLK